MSNAFIELKNANVDFPVYNAASLSLKNTVIDVVRNRRLSAQQDGVLIVRGLSDINLKINPGERVGLVGANGSGKTTLLRVLSGIYYPTGGELVIRGNSTSLINIGLGIDREATGRENIIIRGTMMGLSPAEIKSRINDIIEFTGLGDFIDLPFRTYSSGMQMRLAFAVSTTITPEILIMDEWLSVGDEEFKHQAEQRLGEIINAAEILILASHDRDLLLNTCNRILWLENGNIKLDGSPSEVCQTYFGY